MKKLSHNDGMNEKHTNTPKNWVFLITQKHKIHCMV